MAARRRAPKLRQCDQAGRWPAVAGVRSKPILRYTKVKKGLLVRGLTVAKLGKGIKESYKGLQMVLPQVQAEAKQAHLR